MRLQVGLGSSEDSVLKARMYDKEELTKELYEIEEELSKTQRKMKELLLKRQQLVSIERLLGR